MNCVKAEQAIRRHFVSRRRALPAAVRDHLHDCAHCQEVHDRLFAAEAALGGSADGLSTPEVELLRSRAMPTTSSRRRPLIAAAAAIATATAALLLLLPGTRQPTGSSEGQFTSRGSSGDTPDARAVGLRLLCVPADGGAEAVFALPPLAAAGGGARCPTTGALGLTYFNRSDSTWYVAIEVQTEQPHISPAGTIPLELPPTANDVPLELDIPLEPLANRGAVEVLAVITSTPAALLREGAPTPRPVTGAQAGAQPLGETVQRWRFELTEEARP